MRKKTNVIIILTLLFVIIMSGTYAYSRYAQAAVARGNIKTAAWDILVNECDIVNPDPTDDECFLTSPQNPTDEDEIVEIVRNFRIIPKEDSSDPPDKYLKFIQIDGPLRDGKIGPGSEAEITIIVDSNNTKVAYKYEVTSTHAFTNPAIKVYLSSDADTDTNGDPIEYEFTNTSKFLYKVYASELASGKVIHTIKVRVVWENLIDENTGEETNNDLDTQMGTDELNRFLTMPIKIHFEQMINDD